MIKGTVAEITIPEPPPLALAAGGEAYTEGQAYRLSLPSLATNPVEITTPSGTVWNWTPTELAYRDGQGVMDWLVGSAPVSLEAGLQHARFRRLFPQADDVFVAEADRVKHYTTLNLPPRAPAEYLGAGVQFGVSGTVSGIVLPLGQHEEIEVGDLKLPRPWAVDLRGQKIDGVYEVMPGEEGAQQLFVWFDAVFFLDPATVYPVTIDPTVATAINTSIIGGANQHWIDRFSNGVLLSMVFISGSSGGIAFRYSTDNGATWQIPVTGETIGGVTQYGSGSMRIKDDRVFVLLQPSGGTFTSFAFGTPNAARTGYTWTKNDVVRNNAFSGDIDAHAEGTGWVAHALTWWWSSAPLYEVHHTVIQISNAGVITLGVSTTLKSAGIEIAPTPGVAVDGAKSVYVTWDTQGFNAGRGVRFRKATYSSGAWTWGAEEAVIETVYANTDAPRCEVDSQFRAIVSFTGNDNKVYVLRRGALGGFTNISPAPAVTADYVCHTVGNGDKIYLFNQGSGLVYRVFDSAWTAPITADSNVLTYQINVRRDTVGSAVDALYRSGASSPYSANHVRITLNTPPTAPDGLSPDGGAGRDASTAFSLTATAHDTAGDYPTDAQWEIQEDAAGATVNYVTSAGAITPAATWVATGGGTFNLSRQIAAGALAQGKSWKWRVKTRDSAGAESPWSAYAVFKTSAAPTATITTPAAGGTIAATPLTVECSVADPEGRPLGTVTYRLYADNAGVKGALLVEHADVGASVRTMLLDLTPRNGQYVWTEVVPTDADGITGAAVSRRNLVSMTPPPTPTLALVTQSGSGQIRVTVTNPPPGGGQPAVTGNDLYRQENGGAWVRIASGMAQNAVYDDYTAASGAAYNYRVTAIGSNTATATSASYTAAALALTGIWLHDVSAPGGTALRLERATARGESWEAEAAFHKLAGRSRPVVEFGEQESGQLQLQIAITDAATWPALRALLRRKATLCVRDSAGRRVFAAIPSYPETDEFWGQSVTLNPVEIDHDEAV